MDRESASKGVTSSLGRVALLGIGVAVLSYLAARAGGALIVRSEMVWPLWPGCAVLASILVVTPRKLWPVVLLAGFSAFVFYDLRAGVSVRATSLLIVADTVEILVAAASLNCVFKGVPRLNSIKALASYLFFGVFLGPFAGAFFGALSMNGPYWLNWRIALFTEALAFLTVMPAILSWRAEFRAWVKRPFAERAEGATLFAGVGMLGYVTFVALDGNVPPALLYALLPFLLWSALRFGMLGVSGSVVIIAFQSIWGVVHGHGPFSGLKALDNVLSLQLFLVALSIPFLALAVVVEERKQGEGALRESEQRFRLVANTAPVMIWMSGREIRRDYFNEPWLAFTGSSLGEQAGNGWSKGIHPEDAWACLEAWREAYDRREAFTRQYRLRGSDGEYHWVLDTGVPRFEADGCFAGYIGSCIDVTERKLAEEAVSNINRKLIEAQEAERTRIARELHDDVSQRLALVVINLEQLKQRVPTSQEKIKQGLAEFSDSISQISSDLHTISHRLHSSKLDYLGIATASAALCSELSRQQGVEIHFEQSDVPQNIPQEHSLCVYRVLQEALQNAIKHSGVRQFYVELRGYTDGLELTVKDAGSGFDARAALTGRGLGLVSMQERVHLGNGIFSIESKPNRGTTVRARVPLAVEQQTTVKRAGASAR